MSLKVVYPSIFEKDEYMKPWVKIECGARGAVGPDIKRGILPYIQDELGSVLDLTTEKVTLIKAVREPRPTIRQEAFGVDHHTSTKTED